jgi:serine protease
VTLGPRVVTATATDSGGASSQASVTVNVVNVPPRVTLSAPRDGAEVFRTAVVPLRGSASDRNEPGEVLACSNLVWTSSVAGDPFPLVGCEASAAFETQRQPRAHADGHRPARRQRRGQRDDHRRRAAARPAARRAVTSPSDGTSPPIDLPLTLAGTAADPEGASPLTYRWTVRLGSDDPIVVGGAETVEWTPNQTYAFDRRAAGGSRCGST